MNSGMTDNNLKRKKKKCFGLRVYSSLYCHFCLKTIEKK